MSTLVLTLPLGSPGPAVQYSYTLTADGHNAPRTIVRRPSRFLHRCPVCDFSRVAARPVRSWRCADCVAAGLGGNLVITEKRAPA